MHPPLHTYTSIYLLATVSTQQKKYKSTPWLSIKEQYAYNQHQICYFKGASPCGAAKSATQRRHTKAHQNNCQTLKKLMNDANKCRGTPTIASRHCTHAYNKCSPLKLRQLLSMCALMLTCMRTHACLHSLSHCHSHSPVDNSCNALSNMRKSICQ